MELNNQTDELTGSVLADRYTVRAKLARGGMGAVYEAHDKVLDRLVAVKTISRTTLDDAELVRFHREGKAASTVRHPNVIQMLDFGVTKASNPFMVMELIRGLTLERLIK